MHRLTRVIDDFLFTVLLDSDLKSKIKECSQIDAKQSHCFTMQESLLHIKDSCKVFVAALASLKATPVSKRTPEQLRSSTANLVRAVESFKNVVTQIHPGSDVHNHHEVGCLYGYKQRRTAMLDKAALVAYEKAIDVLSLDEEQLAVLVFDADHTQKSMAFKIDRFCVFINDELVSDEVARCYLE